MGTCKAVSQACESSEKSSRDFRKVEQGAQGIHTTPINEILGAESMKRLTGSMLIVAICLSVLPGCTDTASVKQETKTTTPGGTTTTTTTKEIKKSGENPPPAH